MLPAGTRIAAIICRLVAASLVIFVSSCNVIYVKNYPRNKAFVYKTNITVKGGLSKDSAEFIRSKLQNQVDDSLKVRTVRKLIANGGLNRPVLYNPPVYDPANAEKSVTYMKGLLISLGYFKSNITYNTVIDTVKADQYRAIVNFVVNPGQAILFDSISYTIRHPELQQIVDSSMNETLLRKDEPFAKTTISSELDRLTALFQNNGYLRFNRDLLQGVWDTLNPAVFNPTLDPFDQIALLDSILKSRINPKANIEIRLRPGYDANRLTKYFVGNITVYPDYDPSLPDIKKNAAGKSYYSVFQNDSIFKSKILYPNIYLHHGSLVRIDSITKTISQFNRMGAWRLAEVKPEFRKNEDTADFSIRLIPADKFSFTTNLEGSYNQNAISGNLAGFSINAAVQNRNVWKRAYQSVTNIRFGVETGKDTVTKAGFLQSKQVAFSHTIFFPKAVLVERWMPRKMRENARTIFSFNAANTERRSLFNLSTVNLSWGYEMQWNKNAFTFRFPNIEYSYLKPKAQLETLFVKNPSLRYVFTDGFVSSAIASFTRTGGKGKAINVFRTNAEVSGIISGLIRNNKFLDDNLYRFIKLDAELTRKIEYKRTAIALRLFTGVGYELNSTANPAKQNNLPFFKEYFGGGPNSMRAWALRKLGPGSSIKSFSENPERYGDLQIEGNIEFRYPIANINGVKVNGALFTDMGNIWFLKKAAGRSDEEIFNFSRLGKDLAIGVGTGFRVDFSYFLLRFDISHKVKDPSPLPGKAYLQNKWFGYVEKDFFKGTQLQLGINYPFAL